MKVMEQSITNLSRMKMEINRYKRVTNKQQENQGVRKRTCVKRREMTEKQL